MRNLDDRRASRMWTDHLLERTVFVGWQRRALEGLSGVEDSLVEGIRVAAVHASIVADVEIGCRGGRLQRVREKVDREAGPVWIRVLGNELESGERWNVGQALLSLWDSVANAGKIGRRTCFPDGITSRRGRLASPIVAPAFWWIGQLTDGSGSRKRIRLSGCSDASGLGAWNARSGNASRRSGMMSESSLELARIADGMRGGQSGINRGLIREMLIVGELLVTGESSGDWPSGRL